MNELEPPYVIPIYVSARNCIPATGLPWRTLRALMQRHGADTIALGPRTAVYRSSDVMAAIEACRVSIPPMSEEQEANELLKRLGYAPVHPTAREVP